MTGTIKTLPPGKAFGFILGTDGVDYFFHASDLNGDTRFTDLAIGDQVDFEAMDGKQGKGPRAAQVRTS